MIWALVGVGLTALGVVGLVILAGLWVAREHVASSRITVAAPRRAVWDALADFPNHHTWRPDVKRTERREDVQGRPAWTEHNRFGPLPMYVDVFEPPSRMVTCIIEEGMPFGGCWAYELAEVPEGTQVTITERGRIYNPVFRFLSRFVMSYHATMDGYLKNLSRKFGVEGKPVHVAAG